MSCLFAFYQLLYCSNPGRVQCVHLTSPAGGHLAFCHATQLSYLVSKVQAVPQWQVLLEDGRFVRFSLLKCWQIRKRSSWNNQKIKNKIIIKHRKSDVHIVIKLLFVDFESKTWHGFVCSYRLFGKEGAKVMVENILDYFSLLSAISTILIVWLVFISSERRQFSFFALLFLVICGLSNQLETLFLSIH